MIRIEYGKKGEAIAASYLKEKGYVILETNVRINKKEIDIIAQKSDILVFVEVKSRHNTDINDPESWISDTKKRHIFDAAELYAEKNNLDCELRFDVILVNAYENDFEIRHIEGIEDELSKL